MNRDAVAREVPPAVRAWLHQQPHAVWWAVAQNLAVNVAATLLANNGEAGVNPVIYKSLCTHRSSAVSALAQSATFTGKRWRAKTVARRVGQHFALGFEMVYTRLRWKQK